MTHKKLAPGPQTADDQLALMRKGYNADLKLKVGGLEVPVRLMPVDEEATVIENAKASVKLPNDKVNPKLFVSSAIMKGVLQAAATVDGTPHLSKKFLDKCSHRELNELFDQYNSVCDSANPEFETLSDDKIAEMILAVKKKERIASDFFTSDLAAIGRFFLEQLPLQVSELG